MIRRRLSFVHVLITLAVVSVFTTTSASAHGSSANCNPRVYGAKGDGVSKDTAAIQKAIDVCEQRGGGTVLLDAGTYLSAPIVLKSNITLWLEKGATLLGSPDHGDYPPKTEFREPGLQALVSATNASNVTIRGEGVIDGAGATWWWIMVPEHVGSKVKMSTADPRPRLVVFDHCKHVLVEGITIQNSPDWQLVPYYSDDVIIRNVKVLAPAHSSNTDGIDPFSSSNVRIDHVLVDVGDDDVAIKSGMPGSPGPDAPSRDITITDCTFLHGHGLSLGSELAGGARNIRAERIHFEGTDNGIHVKVNRGRGNDVGPLFFRDIDMKDVLYAVNISDYYAVAEKVLPPDGEAAQPVTRLTPRLHNITIEDLTATGSRWAGVIVGLPEAPITDVVLRNVRIDAQHGLTIRYANVSGTNVVVEASDGQPITKLVGAKVSLR
jgi:polygalacturonase